MEEKAPILIMAFLTAFIMESAVSRLFFSVFGKQYYQLCFSQQKAKFIEMKSMFDQDKKLFRLGMNQVNNYHRHSLDLCECGQGKAGFPTSLAFSQTGISSERYEKYLCLMRNTSCTHLSLDSNGHLVITPIRKEFDLLDSWGFAVDGLPQVLRPASTYTFMAHSNRGYKNITDNLVISDYLDKGWSLNYGP